MHVGLNVHRNHTRSMRDDGWEKRGQGGGVGRGGGEGGGWGGGGSVPMNSSPQAL